MKAAFLTIDYNEFDQSSYKAIDVFLGAMRKRFDSGNITMDFYNYLCWINTQEFSMVNYSSSWDHFFSDGDKYDLLYIDHQNDHKVVTTWPEIDQCMAYPVFVEDNIQTFEDLKKYLKKYIKSQLFENIKPSES